MDFRLGTLVLAILIVVALMYGFEALVTAGNESRRSGRIAAVAATMAILMLQFHWYVIG